MVELLNNINDIILCGLASFCADSAIFRASHQNNHSTLLSPTYRAFMDFKPSIGTFDEEYYKNLTA